jgi:HK97 family phage major capsid protein/HK97 family phage prohead protease
MQKMYSTLEIKSIDEDQRIIEGIASTPSTDRMEDVVESKGAKFRLPLPFLMGHNSDDSIGHVIAATVTNDGIRIKAQIAKDPLLPELDKAWAKIKKGLVRGLSIGFNALEDPEPIKGTFGRRFKSWEWLELSAVVIPANQDASILSIKSADEAVLAVPGDKALPVSILKPSPGASGKPVIPRNRMKTIKQRISDFQAERMHKAARVKELMSKEDGGLTLDAEESNEFDTLDAEIKQIDTHLKRLERAEELNRESAQPVVEQKGEVITQAAPVPALSGLRVKSNLEPGVRFARWAQAQIRGNFHPERVLAAIQADQVWMRSTPELALVAKTAIPAADTTTTGWASELVYAENLASEFIEFLRPMTLIGRIPGFSRVPFNIRAGGMSAGLTGYWVQEGNAIPVSKGTTTSVTLGITKAAGIASITKELARLSTPSAELMIRNDLAKAIQVLLDDSFINPNNGGIPNAKPASILYGVTPVTPSAATYAGLRADIQTLMETAFDANLGTAGSVWIMSMSAALKLSMMVNALDQRVNPDLTPNGGTFQGYPVIVSQIAQISGSPQFNDIIVFLHPGEIFLADDGGVTLESSDQVSLQLLDNPTNLSTGATAPTSVVSMFQTESIAIKAVRFINWGKKRTTAAQWIQAAAYV